MSTKYPVQYHAISPTVRAKTTEMSYSYIGVASYGALGHVPPLDLQQLICFSALWPVQSLTATICRQLPPVKTQQLLHVPLLAPIWQRHCTPISKRRQTVHHPFSRVYRRLFWRPWAWSVDTRRCPKWAVNTDTVYRPLGLESVGG